MENDEVRHDATDPDNIEHVPDPSRHTGDFEELRPLEENPVGWSTDEVTLEQDPISEPDTSQEEMAGNTGSRIPRVHFVNCWSSRKLGDDALSVFSSDLETYFKNLDYTTTKNRRLRAGDTIVGTDANSATVIVTVGQVDNNVQYSKSYWVTSLSLGANDLARVFDVGAYAGEVNWIFVFHSAGGGIGSECCVPLYSELKFTATPDDGTGTPSLRTWDCLQWDGSQYIGMNTDTTAPGDYSLQVFYDQCGRGWTAVIEPTNTQSMLGTLTASGGANNITTTGAAGGTYVYTGGGPIMYGDSASQVATTISFDTHPCGVDLVNMENQLLDGENVSGLMNVSDTMRIYACS